MDKVKQEDDKFRQETVRIGLGKRLVELGKQSAGLFKRVGKS